MLKEKINADYMTAFKSKDTVAKNLLSVIKGEIQTLEKNSGVTNLSDDDVIKILAKTRKSLEETRSKFPSDQVTTELYIVESYLPKQMSEDEIRSKIQELVESGQAGNIAEVMRAFGSLPADRKLVASVYQSIK
jgi:uncharacterized protein YqeY